MPELPEVERGRRLAEATVGGQRLIEVHCEPDEFVFDEANEAEVAAALRGRRVLAVRRRGKQLWFELDRPPHPLFHFGMTGSFRTLDAVPLELESSSEADRDPAVWPPRFTKIRMIAEDGAELVMTNKRRLGRIRLRAVPEEEAPIARLGFDPLLDPPGPAEFTRALRRRDARVKALLLDQGFAAGVGNWIADEVLYQARIDPRRRASDLDEAEAKRVRSKLLSIVRKAVEVDAEKARLPRTWLFHRRWGKTEGAKTARGEAIEFTEVGGRTTAWVPSRQG